MSAFLLFLALMDYPYLSRLYNDHISGRVIASFEKSEADADCENRRKWAQAYNCYLAGIGPCPEIPSDAAPAQSKLARASGTEIEDVEAGPRTKPKTAEDIVRPDEIQSGADMKEYTAAEKKWMEAALVLCPEEDEPAGWIRIASLNLNLPLYIGTGDDALGKGAGILELRSLPVGGDSTHTCISAHRGLPDRTLFTNLDLLRKGDLIEVHTLGRTICYQVYGNETVLPSDTKALEILPGKDLLTLITCTPYGINSHRLYVHAQRCEENSVSENSSPHSGLLSMLHRLTDPVFWKLWWWAIVTPALLILMLLLVLRSFR